ncbi:MAG: tetratricopeptide repeat protein [Planctomycetaceae bacterium]|nr:tetratricopeptide repeat protein [Planctomycetaceae bacterium]
MSLRARILALFIGCAVVVPAEAQSPPPPPRTRVINRQHEEWKTQADQAYRQGDFDKSIELTERVITANPNDDVALYLRGSARVEFGARTRNADLVRNGIADAREAIRIVNRVKIDYYLPYLYGMSQLSGLEGKTSHAETARDVAAQLLEMESVTVAEKANIAYQRALLNIQLQDRDAALVDFAKAVEFEPQHLAAQLGRCDLLLQTAQPDQVEQAYAEIVEKFPQEPLVFNNRGMFFQSFGRNDEAIADFTKAIEINAQYVPAYTNRAYSKLEAGAFSEAIADLNKAVEIDPQYPAAHSLRGSAYLQSGDANSALADYEAALQLNPDNPQVRSDVGFAQFFAGKYDLALTSFDSALEADPQARFLNPWCASALLYAGRRADAEQRFADVIAKPADQRDWFDLLTLLVLGKVTDNDALATVSEGDEQAADAQKCEAFYFIGQRLLFEEKPEEAEPFFRQALESKSLHLSAFRGAQFALGEFGPRA